MGITNIFEALSAIEVAREVLAQPVYRELPQQEIIDTSSPTDGFPPKASYTINYLDFLDCLDVVERNEVNVDLYPISIQMQTLRGKAAEEKMFKPAPYLQNEDSSTYKEGKTASGGRLTSIETEGIPGGDFISVIIDYAGLTQMYSSQASLISGMNLKKEDNIDIYFARMGIECIIPFYYPKHFRETASTIYANNGYAIRQALILSKLHRLARKPYNLDTTLDRGSIINGKEEFFAKNEKGAINQFIATAIVKDRNWQRGGVYGKLQRIVPSGKDKKDQEKYFENSSYGKIAIKNSFQGDNVFNTNVSHVTHYTVANGILSQEQEDIEVSNDKKTNSKVITNINYENIIRYQMSQDSYFSTQVKPISIEAPFSKVTISQNNKYQFNNPKSNQSYKDDIFKCRSIQDAFFLMRYSRGTSKDFPLKNDIVTNISFI